MRRCPVRGSLGVYVLDALDPSEHESVARHLARCRGCRHEVERIASLPALLERVPLCQAEGLVSAPASRRPAQGRAMTGTVGVALLLVLAAGALLGAGVLRAGASVSAANPATEARMTADTAALPWGTRIVLRLSGVAPGERCRLVARAADGRVEEAARWQATYRGYASVEATTSIPATDLAELSVITVSGRRLVRAEM